MASECCELVYRFYRALTYGLSPLVYLHLRWRKFRGREHPLRWRERLGRSSLRRPPGPLIWFHAVSLGNCIFLNSFSNLDFTKINLSESVFDVDTLWLLIGEGMAAIPVIKCCVERRPDVAVLMTTTTTSAL